MKTTAILVEFIVIGFLSSILVLLFYAISYPCEINNITQLIAYNKGLSTIVLTILWYILGTITHRFTQILYKSFIKIFLKLTKLFHKKSLNQTKTSTIDKFLSLDKIVKALQYGSDSVVNRIIYEQSLLRIFESSTILFPTIGLLYFIWDCKNGSNYSGIFVLILTLIMMFMALICYIIQLRSIRGFIDRFCKMLDKDKKNDA
jgi:fructose-specific phosphotransferase system IIC component